MMSNKYPTQWLRRSIQVGLASLVAVAGLLTFSAAAVVADANVVTAAASCASTPGAGYTITWTVANGTNLSETGTVTAATGGTSTVTPSTFTIAASGNGSGGTGSAPFQNTTLTQTLPATTTGAVSLTTQGTWSDGTVAKNSGTADLSTLDCGSTSQSGTGTGTTNDASTTTTTTPSGLESNALLAPAATGSPLSCSSTTIYNLTTQGGVFSLNVSNSANTSVTTIGDGSDMNSLGITPDGSTLYAANQSPSNGKTTIYEKNVVSGTSTNFPNEPATGINILIAGAFNPGNGLFYYGGWNSAGNSFILFAFNPTSGTAVEAGTVTPTNSTKYGAGDIAFDGAGNLYIMAGASDTSNNSELIVVPSPIPSSGTGVLPHPSTPLATIPHDSGSFDGIAFTTSGSLFVQDTSGDFDSVNPNTGVVTPLPKQTGLGNQDPYDLAGCSLNGTLQVQKNIVGRSVAGDQFTMTITGGGVTSGNVGTTTGSTTGQQTGTNEVAGPIVGIPATTYNVAETAASGSLGNYKTTYACLNGSTPVTTSGTGTGTSFSLSFPVSSGTSGANVICTFTNTPAGFTVTKSASPAAPSGVFAGSSTPIDYTLTAKNTSAITTGTALAVSDAVPTGTTLIAGSQGCTGGPPTCAFSVTGSTLNWNIPAGVPAGGTYSLTFAVTANAGDASGNILNTGTFTGPGCTTSPSCSTNTTTTVVTAPAPAVTIAKTATVSPPADQSAAKLGDTIAYTYKVTNSGNITLATVAVTDPTGGPVTCPVPTAPGLAIGASETCTANSTHTVTQADVDAGKVVDTATATGKDILGNGSPTSAPSTATVNTVAPGPAVTIVKTATVTPSADQSAAKLGDSIAYTYKVTNSGNVTLATVAVTDPTGGAVTCPVPTAPGLAIGASETCTANATHTVTQADVDAGKVVDTATAKGTDTHNNTSPQSAPSSATVNTVAPAPAVTIVKTATVTPSLDQNGAKLGDTIAYTYKVTNSGNVTLASVAVTDPTGGSVTCPVPSAPGLAIGASETCTANATHTVTQADVDAGVVNDTATAKGTDTHSHTSPPSAPSTASVPTVAPGPAVTIVKTATVTPSADQSAAKLGDTIAYTYKVTNSGNVTLASVAVTDPTGGAVTCPVPSAPGLAIGASETCTANATHTVTQADVDAGKVVDTATAKGTDTHNNTSPQSAPSTATVNTVAPAPAVTIVKTATVTPSADQSAAKLGDTIAYTYKVTNSGNVTLASVAVTDPTGGSVTCPVPTAPGLAPGANETCTANATHLVTQADVDAGKVVDTATAKGTDTHNNTSPQSAPSTATVNTVAPAPAVTIVKTATVTPSADQNGAKLGDTIAYTYKVTNVGNVTLASVAVTDPTGGSVTCPVPSAPGLAIGASETCTANATHLVTQADVDAGVVNDTATATGTDTHSHTSPPSAPSTASVPTVAPGPAVTIVKTATVSPVADQNGAKLGDTIAYTYKVTNSGNVTLATVAVTDPTGGAVTCPVPTAPGLAIGANETCTANATHLVTQADVDAGKVVDTATATGTDAHSNTSPPSAPSTATVNTVAPAPAVTIVKTATVTPSADQNGAKVGDTIAYTYKVTNVGNVTLASVAVTDPTGGSVTCPVPTAPGLAPGAHETCTANATHTVTQADVDAGKVVDTATATGTDTHSNASPPSDPSTATVNTVAPAPAVTIVKTATVTPSADQDGAKLGDTIAYSYKVTNVGNVTLASVAVTDPTGGAVTCPAPSAPGLAPGANEVCTANATHTVTQADVDAGVVNDTATATGTDTHSNTSPPSDPSTASVPVTQTTGISVVKSSTSAHFSAVGDSIAYNFLVTNTGNVTLNNVSINDTQTPPANQGNLSAIDCPSSTLAPGISETCTATYTVTQADIANASVSDSATAQGDPPGSSTPIVSDPPSTLTIPVMTTPVLTTQATTLPVTVGNPISDAATITGISGSGLPTGSVAFFVCGPTTAASLCTTTTNPVTSATVPSGSDSGFVSTGTSGTFVPTVAGFYCFAAVFTPGAGGHYNGTTDNQSDTVRSNECVDVLGGGGDNSTASTTTTHVSSATVTAGNKVTDAVTVTGASGSGLPMGSVAFFVCGPSTSNALCASTTNTVGTATVPATADTGTVSTGTSTSFTPTTPGIYCFAAVFTPVVGTNYAGSTDNQTGTLNTNECTTVVAAAASGGSADPAAKVVSTGPLAFTGAWLGAEVKWAILMLAFGLVAVMVARRRLRKPARSR